MAMLNLDESKQKIVAVTSVVVIVVCVAIVFGKLGGHRPKPSKIAFDVQLEVGAVAAEEIGKLIGNRGRLLLVAADTSRFKIPQADAQRKGFLEAVKKAGTLTVVATEKIDPQTFMSGPEFGFPAEVFFNILTKYPDVDGIVSLVGPPRLSTEEMNHLPPKIPKVVAVIGLGFPVKLKKLFENQIVFAAIAPRFGPPPSVTQEPKTVREWFGRGFQVITPEIASPLRE